MKLYYGGFGNHSAFTVAENEQQAIEQIGKKINAPYLPIQAKKIERIDGYTISAVKDGEVKPNAKVEQPKPTKPVTKPIAGAGSKKK